MTKNIRNKQIILTVVEKEINIIREDVCDPVKTNRMYKKKWANEKRHFVSVQKEITSEVHQSKEDGLDCFRELFSLD